MKRIKPLGKSRLYKVCNPKQFWFKNTAEIKEFDDIVGQERAVESLTFGIGIQHHGFNLYVQGPSGVGKHAAIINILEKFENKLPCPDDWCYVYNFKNPRKPLALKVPHGHAKELKKDMESFIEDVQTSVPAIFESDEYRQKIHGIEKRIKNDQEEQFSKLQEMAEVEGLTILSTPHGFAVVPLKDGQAVSPEELAKLSKKEKKERAEKNKFIKSKLMDLLAQLPILQKKARERKKIIQKSLAKKAIKYLLAEMREKYQKIDAVCDYLRKVERDIIEHIGSFFELDEVQSAKSAPENIPNIVRYQVNVLVSHSSKCIPIIYEDNPTYYNLIGRIDQKIQLGVLVTDQTMIRAGALHRANGGYLLVDANKLLVQPFAWAAIKRALYANEIRIEPMGELSGLPPTISLEPEPIPLDVKVIIIGDRSTYYMLSGMDPDFSELFKVEVDFNDDMKRNKDNNLLYAKLLAGLIKKAKLLPFDSHAIARIIEHSSRLVNDSEKLSLHMRSLEDLLMESDYWARQAHRRTVKYEDVQTAILQKYYRANRIQKVFYEEIERGNVLIDLHSESIGQINALSIMHYGDYQFGLPVRITAAVRLGKGDIINIERESNLSGDVLTKSVYILSGFIYNRYAKDFALSMLASLVFEQSYNEIEGDSASVPELCALLSAIGEFPLKQSIAVTGSVNQHGGVQPVGGINDKIEGFFAICKYHGLTGEQGVIIPAANVKHLMLASDIIEAVADKKFHIYAINNVDEALQLLSGLKAGQPDKDGHFTPGSCNAKVEQRLREFAMHYEK